ncbi:MAG: hypothetical protein KatS3mg082_2736 [Nitrospiraceae bacterium]|nr:MAG: hypothetical protein KatS3mg082_2544 [Nitrospiraceae bacterium]GIW56332.1 MAG: hypothetical protein KatS3mg082_2736 [Nitrospiraceae bacterium]GIW81339.1 MAG: hypothetical protein KatS3mg105_3146 [Gemmatales bacterium]
MAEIVEKFDSREQTVSEDNPVVDLRYAVIDTDDDSEVRALVEATIPAFYNGKPFQQYRITPAGGGVWDVEVRYGSREPKKPGDWSFHFDTSGGSAKIFQSLNTTAYVAPDDDEIDFHGAIGVTDDGGTRKVEGVEITVPQFSFTVTRILSSPINPAYLNALEQKTGKVNSDPVVLLIDDVSYTFLPGELKFESATGGKRNSENWEITIKCSAARNRSGIQFGDISGIDKKGWEYLWVYYEDAESANTLIKKPRQVMVEQVIEETTLGELFA